MILILDAALLGVFVGFLRGGKFSNLSHTRLKGETVLVLLLAFVLVWPSLSQHLGTSAYEVVLVWILASLVLLAVSLMNLRHVGMVIASAGLLLNLVVVTINWGMPVLVPPAREASAEGAEIAVALRQSGLHVEEDDETRLALLGDRILVPGPSWHRGLVSCGDVLLSIGVCFVVASGMRGPEETGESQQQLRAKLQ